MVSRVAPVHANDSSRHDMDETKLQFIGFLERGQQGAGQVHAWNV
jgi:hypothetical protein